MAEQRDSLYYDEDQRDDKQHLQDFHQHLHDSLIRTESPVTSQRDEPEEFVPFELIEEYCIQEGRLLDILSAIFPDEDPIPVEETVVQTQYLKTLCILLSIGAARYIRHFAEYSSLSDGRVPHTSKPDHFPISSGRPNLWEDFYKAQWVFCAAEIQFKTNERLEPDRILPIIKREVLGEGGSAMVSKIVLHPSFNKLGSNPSSSKLSAEYNNTFVLKTYHKHEAEQYYHNEVEAFRRLRLMKGTSDPNIIPFYGSFTQNGTYNVILAYADKATLEEYFKTVLPPTSGPDIEHFWASLCGIIKALIHIHGVESQNTMGGPQILQGWHQDVKPDNILVMSNGIDSPYQWKFLLSDLGMSHFKRWSNEGVDIDAYGTETYGAPECYRADRFLEESTMMVKQNVDIWSFGCILAEAAVWLVHGYPGLQKFRHGRRASISAIPDMKDGDWFHDGTKVLPMVLETLDSLEENFRKSDRVTADVLEKLVKVMLDEPDIRCTAKQAHKHALRVLTRTSAIPSVTPQSPKTPESFLSAAGSTPTATSGYDGGRLAQTSETTMRYSLGESAAKKIRSATADAESLPAQNTRNAQNGSISNLIIPSPTHERQSSLTLPSRSSLAGDRSPIRLGSPVTPTVSHTRSTSYVGPKPTRSQPNQQSQPELPSLAVDVAERWIRDSRGGTQRKLAGEYLLERLGTRNHVFLIDDAKTMKAHETEVKRIIDILAYFVRNSDPDGLELYFTGSNQRFREKDPSKLVAKFMSNNPRGLTDIRIRLTSIIDNFIRGFDRTRLMKVFKPVRSLTIYILTDGIWEPDTDLTHPLRRLAKKLDENGQYNVGIQFISFGNGEAALKRLNELDDNLGQEIGRDMIDHEKSTGNVWKMLFGSINPWFDGSNPSQAT